jgi:crotonobetainyl-CoA hydratase
MTAVLTEPRGYTLLITLNRPGVLNAVDGAITRELGAALQLLEDSPQFRVGVITGAGRAFCSGLDLKAVAAGASIEATRDPRWGFAGMTARQLAKPLVAAVNGDAIGGGFEIALACDIIVSSSSARFALPEVRRGLFAAGGGVSRLVQQLPEKVALELMLTGRLADAHELLRWGVVHSTVPLERVVADALSLASQIAENAPLAVRATKRLATAARTLSPAEVAALSDAETAVVFPSRDAREGMEAFRERRKPIFTGE